MKDSVSQKDKSRSDTIRSIIEVFENTVCSACGMKNTKICQYHKKRCYEMYEKEADQIYEKVIIPIKNQQ